MGNNTKLSDELESAYAISGQIGAIAQVAANVSDDKLKTELFSGIQSLAGKLDEILSAMVDKAVEIEQAAENMASVV